MGSVVAGRNSWACWKKEIGKPNLAIMKEPPRVLGRILIKSAGVVLGDKSRSKSSESRSVKLLDLPTGISFKSFLIQKTSMAGKAEKPINVQPSAIWKYSRAMPPKSKVMKITSVSVKTGGLLSERF